MIIVDDNSMAGLLQPDQFYKIEAFEGNQKDRQLCRLASFLKHLAQKKSIGSVRTERATFESIEIPLKDKEEVPALIPVLKALPNGRSIAERKKQYSHKKANS